MDHEQERPGGLACAGSGCISVTHAITPMVRGNSFFIFVLLQKYTQHLLSGTPAFHDHAHVGVRSHAGATSIPVSLPSYRVERYAVNEGHDGRPIWNCTNIEPTCINIHYAHRTLRRVRTLR